MDKSKSKKILDKSRSCLPSSCLFLTNAVSVTRWLDYFSIFGHLQQWKFALKHQIFAKADSKFCQTLNNAFKIFIIINIFCVSGAILPNLVTLIVVQLNQLLVLFAAK